MDTSGAQKRKLDDSERLREIEERFRALSEHSTEPISEVGRDLRLLYVSPSFTKVFGWEPQEVLGTDVLHHVHPGDRERIRGIHATANVGEAVSQLCFRYRHKNGSWRWVELTGCPYRTSAGEIRAILVNRDVTDRVIAQNELRDQLDSETRVEALSRYFLTIGTDDFESGIRRGLAAASELAGAERSQFFAFDADSGASGKYFEWRSEGFELREWSVSEEMMRLYAWSSAKLRRGEAIVAARVSDLPIAAAPEREGLLGAGVKSYLAIPIVHGETTVGFLDFFCLETERSWSSQDISRLSLLADVFASALRRHQAETKRRETEIRFQALAEHTSDSICELSADGKILYASPSFCEISGYTPDELGSMKAAELIHPGDRFVVEPANMERLTAENGTATVRSKIRHRDGDWRWLEATARPFRTESGENRFAVVIRDVTLRQQAQTELEQQLKLERRLAALLREFLDQGAGEIDVGIRHALETAGTLAGADRCWLIAGDGGNVPESFEWCAEGIPPRSVTLGLAEKRDRAWVYRQLLAAEPVHVSRASDLPAEAQGVREQMQRDGLKSFLLIPILSHESLIGVLGFHSLRRERSWTDHEVYLFQLVSGIFTSALRRRNAEASLRESEERFRALAEHAKDPICEVDELGSILFASPSLSDLLGYEREELASLNLFELIHEDDLQSLREQYAASDSPDGLPGTVLYRARHKEGTWIVLEGTARAFKSASGEIRIVAVVRDVTERQRAQRTLERQLDLETRIAMLSRRFLAVAAGDIDRTIRESLADLAALSESDRSWLVSIDPGAGSIVEVFEWNSPEAPASHHDLASVDSRGFQWAAKRMLSGNVCHFPDVARLPAEARHERESLEHRNVRSFLGIPLHSGNQPVSILGFETVTRQKTWSAETITLLRLVGEIFVSALQRKNIEKNLRDSQQQLMQAQKMEAVGTLAGGIAHDFNNQLTVMLGNARYVMRQVGDDPDIKDALTDLNRAAEHCAQLTRSLLAFSRRSPVAPRSLNVHQAVAQVEDLLRPLIPSSIQFEIDSPPGLANIEADPTQLQQVLVNLAINARDAMPDGGRLAISTTDRRIDAIEATRLALPRAGNYVEIAVIDSGRGIDEETRKRIFEPFFTTKPLGQGTGLGLATAYGIVTECRGMICVESEVGRGTAFRVLLPNSQAEAAVALASPHPSGEGAARTILVVDDESAVRRFLRSTLERNGFEVLQAAGSAEAMLLIAANADRIAAIVTDIHLPEMNGADLAHQIADCAPGVPILFVSGSTDPLFDAAQRAITPENFLQKPFGEEDFLVALRRVITDAEQR